MKNLQDFPRICLAALPTPIQKLENISRLLGTNIYIKRDDLTLNTLGGHADSQLLGQRYRVHKQPLTI